MLCLFRNTKLSDTMHFFALFLSLGAVGWWLYYAFIEKALLPKLYAGKALLADLVFGLPLVLILSVVVYATVYWSVKMLVVLLMPKLLIPINQHIDLENEDDLVAMEQKLGEQYWLQHPQDNPNTTVTSSTADKQSNVTEDSLTTNAKDTNNPTDKITEQDQNIESIEDSAKPVRDHKHR